MTPAGQGKPLDLRSLIVETMQAADIEQVMVIENSVYPHPWTRGNFTDSLDSGYEAWVAREPNFQLAGYFLAMPVVDELHLLNISVRADLQGQGLGLMLLDRVTQLARKLGMLSILLEVRPSNQRALAVYERYGFVRIGLRKAYYPAAGHTREDAIVMRLCL
ncbi:ribosomal-protein-alanine N-acetyltransferase [Paucimonas lemoignei]|uniref:[Ribosomal protein bS18]-alanine N-acetyltransferase n=1 Tax=Paucimonas lemoignei TaxID=29443 RepID=A0A4R3I5E7_PAULE|nr:ribosomal protein S18-alanine N-acetyltransferase [Paucimonas lemoignei]TCS39219.1 ribosomal-protein-alanine N-acetyltransferase [Paucimonas lemoignei]